MKDAHEDEDEVIRQCFIRRQRIADLEKELARQRGLRRTDASWLARNSELTRTAMAAVLGISRVTLDKYLEDAGLADRGKDAPTIDSPDPAPKAFRPGFDLWQG
jgi:hypothetical protein